MDYLIINISFLSESGKFKLQNVQACVRVWLVPDPSLLEYTDKRGGVFRNIVAWVGGRLTYDPSSWSYISANHLHQTTAPNPDAILRSFLFGFCSCLALVIYLALVICVGEYNKQRRW